MDNTYAHIYIASPYTVGDAALNVRKNLHAADIVLEYGGIPFAPLLTHFWDFLSPKPWEEWMEYSEAWVSRCDGLWRLPGDSKGADREVVLANNLGLGVFYTRDAVISYLRDYG